MARITERNGKYKVILELGRDHTGKRIRHTKEGFKTKKEARAYATIKENELLNNISPTSNKVLLKDFILQWYQNHICNSNLAINTITNYKVRIETHIIPYLGNKQLNKIQIIDVQNFYYFLIKNGLKADSAKRIILVLRKCFNYAKKMNIINNVPCDIEYIKDIKNNKIKVWTEEQLLDFLNEIKGTYLYFPVILTAFTGLRIGELCGLRYSNIDFKNSRIKICEQVINDKINKTLVHSNILKTSKSNRKITIPNFLKEIIKENKQSNEFVIVDRQDNMCNPRNLSMDFRKNVLKISKEKNLPQISFHDLRHTHATILLLHGENIKVISERLGHESVKITLDTYSHVLPSMEEHTSLLLENIFKDKLMIQN
ncbi:site-specific integrase [uncultured Clostridium sp.]|uniref:site-specific integrase n=1 Tax=uncultured Clostridium sp. TaxID=59620 RepID=UPI00280AFAF4|nr:site-specific integrase [uncultured Clostridium sp.]